MKPLIFITIALLAAGCSPQMRVYSDHDPDYRIQDFSTFDWGQKVNIEANQNPLHYNEMNDKRIKTAIQQQLTGLGYVQSNTKPEIYIHYHIIVDDRSMMTTEPYGYYGPYWMRTHTNVYSYREGTFIIDFMDSKTHNLIWRGWITTELDMITPDQTEEIITKAVSKILKHLPPSVRQPDKIASQGNT
jgi:hypothetical protein